MNDEFFNDTDLDRWLRENADRKAAAPAPDGWDTPSEAVWHGLRNGLDQRKKRRRLLGLWLMLIAIFSGGAFWYFTPNTMIPPMENTAAGKTTEQARPIPDSGQPTAEPGPPVLQSTAAAAPSTKQTTNTKTAYPGPASAVRTVRAGDPFAQSPALRPNAGPTFSGVNDAALSAQRRTAASAAGLDMQLPGHGSGQEPEDAATPAPVSTTVVAEPAVQPMHPATVLPMAWPAPTIPPRPFQWPAAPPVQPHRSKRHWYAGLEYGAFYTSRVLKTQNGKVPNGQESGAWAPEFGLKIGLPLSRQWTLETGLQSAGMHIQARRTVRFNYRTNLEQYDAQNFAYRSSTDQNIETSFGQVEMRMNVSREPNRPIADQAVVEIALNTDEQVRYLRAPLTLRWQGGAGRWQWSAGGGLGLNFEQGYALRLTAARANRPGLRDITVRRLRNRAAGLAPLMVDAQIDAGLRVRLASRWSFRLAPEFRYGLNSMYQGGPFRSLAVSGGFQFGVYWGWP